MKARGVKLGRRPKLTPCQQREAIKKRDNGENGLARRLGQSIREGCQRAVLVITGAWFPDSLNR
jgi:hypothetical protein